MKAKIGALALLCGAHAAFAQSNVTIYGMLDAGLRNAPNLAVSEDTMASLDDASRNRIGFRGKEDLGNGLSAFYRMEHSFRADTGAQRDPKKFFDDKAWVGMEHVRYGSVALGRLRSPVDEMTSGTRFEAFEGFSLAAAVGRFGRADDAWDNAAYYTSPAVSGFKWGVGQRAGEGVTRNASGVHFEYTTSRFDIGLAYQVDGETLSSKKRSLGGGVSYKAGPVRFFGTFVQTIDIGEGNAGRATTATVGTRVPLGPGEFRASFRKVDADQILGSGNAQADVDTMHVGIGYHYPLSRRASLNASIVRLSRKTYVASGAVATDRAAIGSEFALRVSF